MTWNYKLGSALTVLGLPDGLYRNDLLGMNIPVPALNKFQYTDKNLLTHAVAPVVCTPETAR